MRLLITGGTGFIGNHFIPVLTNEGHHLTLLDLHPSPTSLPEGVRFIQGDVRDHGAVRRALEGQDAVLHLAAAHHDFGLSREAYFSVNEQGTRVLCAAMEEVGVTRLCFFSSAAVYGSEGPHDEHEQPDPGHPYGESKLAAERVVTEWCNRGTGRSCLVMRPTVVFGPGNAANMLKLIRQIDRGFFLPVGAGGNRKSMAYVSNLVDATLHVWFDHPAGVAVYNYADKPDLSSRDIIELIYAALGRSKPRFSVPMALGVFLARPFDFLSLLMRRPLAISSQRVRKLAGVTSVFDASAIRRTGYAPEVPLDEGVRRMVDWYVTAGDEAPEARLPPARVQVFA